MTTYFVLVHPTNPGNIGAAARAIKTMGFKFLRLVSSRNSGIHLEEMALKMAYGSHDILKSARLFDSLEDALSDIDFAIATTAKKRTKFYDYFKPERARQLVESKSLNNLAIVFGREDHGLEGEEIELCDIISTIDLAQEYPSINLAQCIMIYSFVFSQIEKNETNSQTAVESEQKILKTRASALFNSLGISNRENLNRRMMERLMQANRDDSHLFLSFHRFLIRKFKQLS